VHRHRLGEEENYKTAPVFTAMMELDHWTATNPSANVIPEHPHSAVTATAKSAAELLSVLTAVNFRWDCGRNDTADVSTFVYERASFLMSVAR